MNKTVNYKDLMKYGFPEHTARNIIASAKKIAVAEFESEVAAMSKKNRSVIEYMCSPFANPRVGVAPTRICEMLIGFSLSEKESEK